MTPYAKDCWLVAIDARHAMILKNEGDDCYPLFKLVKGYEQHMFAPDAPDDEPMQKEYFLRKVADYLENDCALGSFGGLIIAARPVIMVELHRAMSPRLKQFIVAEILEDLLTVPLEHIDKRVRGVRAPSTATHATQVLKQADAA